MTSRKYPDMPAHLAEHKEFISSLKKLKETLHLEGTTLGLIVRNNFV